MSLLSDAGFTQEEVSFLAGDTRGHQTPKDRPRVEKHGK